MGLSTTVFDRMPQAGGSGLRSTAGPGTGAIACCRAAWKLTVSVTHSPSLRMLVWKAMLTMSYHGSRNMGEGRRSVHARNVAVKSADWKKMQENGALVDLKSEGSILCRINETL